MGDRPTQSPGARRALRRGHAVLPVVLIAVGLAFSAVWVVRSGLQDVRERDALARRQADEATSARFRPAPVSASEARPQLLVTALNPGDTSFAARPTGMEERHVDFLDAADAVQLEQAAHRSRVSVRNEGTTDAWDVRLYLHSETGRAIESVARVPHQATAITLSKDGRDAVVDFGEIAAGESASVVVVYAPLEFDRALRYLPRGSAVPREPLPALPLVRTHSACGNCAP